MPAGAPRAQPRFKIIYLELTNACNFTCDYCPIDQQTRKKVAMPVELAERIIREIAEHNLTYFLTFHVMGEPYLHRGLVPLTRLAESLGVRVRLLTNGSLLERSLNEQIFATGLSRLEVGFRTPNQRSYDLRLRGRSTDLAGYVTRVKDLLADRLRLAPNTEICLKFFVPSFAAGLHLGDKYDHLTNEADNLRVVGELRAHVLDTARRLGQPVGDWASVPLRTTDGEYFIFPGVSVGFSRIQDFWMREHRLPSAPLTGYPAVVGGCSAAFRDDFGILANGEVTTCCVDYDGKNVVGDLRNRSLIEVLDSDEARRMRSSFDRLRPPTAFCRQCLGGPTLGYSLVKQASSIAVDLRDRLRSRKRYSPMRRRLESSAPKFD